MDVTQTKELSALSNVDVSLYLCKSQLELGRSPALQCEKTNVVKDSHYNHVYQVVGSVVCCTPSSRLPFYCLCLTNIMIGIAIVFPFVIYLTYELRRTPLLSLNRDPLKTRRWHELHDGIRQRDRLTLVPVGGLHNGFLHKSATSTRFSSTWYASVHRLPNSARPLGCWCVNCQRLGSLPDSAATPLPSCFDNCTVVLWEIRQCKNIGWYLIGGIQRR